MKCVLKILLVFLLAKNLQAASSLNSKDNYDSAIESLNFKMLLKGFPRKDFISYTIKSGDNLVSIAGKHNIPYEFLMDINNIISPAQIKVGQVIYIPAPTLIFKIKVDIQKNILILFKGDEKIKQFNVASGAKETPTPKGIFTIGNRIANPTWTLDGKNIPGGDPQNGLGSRWMGFKERTQYGIHGTNEPDSIGKSVSHGCIRLLNQDVEELYKIIPIGTKVEIL